MKVLYHGETIELNDKTTDEALEYDVFSQDINVETTKEFDPNIFKNTIPPNKLLEKTIDLGGKEYE